VTSTATPEVTTTGIDRNTSTLSGPGQGYILQWSVCNYSTYMAGLLCVLRRCRAWFNTPAALQKQQSLYKLANQLRASSQHRHLHIHSYVAAVIKRSPNKCTLPKPRAILATYYSYHQALVNLVNMGLLISLLWSNKFLSIGIFCLFSASCVSSYCFTWGEQLTGNLTNLMKLSWEKKYRGNLHGRGYGNWNNLLGFLNEWECMLISLRLW